jgi:hypothetical protein
MGAFKVVFQPPDGNGYELKDNPTCLSAKALKR